MAKARRKIPKGLEYSKSEIIIKLIRQTYSQVDEIRYLRERIKNLEEQWQKQEEKYRRD